jgi:hypothetical protein
MSWALLVHSETGLSTVVNNDPAAIKLHEDRGWVLQPFPEWVDPDAPNVADRLADGPPVDAEPSTAPETVNGVKGKRRSRTADNEAELAETTTTEEGVE